MNWQNFHIKNYLELELDLKVWTVQGALTFWLKVKSWNSAIAFYIFSCKYIYCSHSNIAKTFCHIHVNKITSTAYIFLKWIKNAYCHALNYTTHVKLKNFLLLWKNFFFYHQSLVKYLWSLSWWWKMYARTLISTFHPIWHFITFCTHVQISRLHSWKLITSAVWFSYLSFDNRRDPIWKQLNMFQLQTAKDLSS